MRGRGEVWVAVGSGVREEDPFGKRAGAGNMNLWLDRALVVHEIESPYRAFDDPPQLVLHVDDRVEVVQHPKLELVILRRV